MVSSFLFVTADHEYAGQSAHIRFEGKHFEAPVLPRTGFPIVLPANNHIYIVGVVVMGLEVARAEFKLNPAFFPFAYCPSIWALRLDAMDAEAEVWCEPPKKSHNTLLIGGCVSHSGDHDLSS